MIPGLLIFALLVVVIIICWEKHELYEEYRYPNEEFFGKELYSEILYGCSEYESKIGNEILDKAIQVADYKGTEEKAEKEIGDVGALRRYYYFVFYNWKDPSQYKVISQEMNFKFITCKVTGDGGHVWVVYTRIMRDENGKVTGGSANILCLWYIEKQEDEWRVVEIWEAP